MLIPPHIKVHFYSIIFRTPRRIVERFNTKFPSPLPTPTRFDESADSAANMSLIHSQSSPKSTKNASFAGEFYNLSIDGGQLLDDLPNVRLSLK